jgi:hypothetical protein
MRDKAGRRSGGRTVSDNPDVSEIRDLPDSPSLDLHAEKSPALLLTQGTKRVRTELAHIKTLVAALADAAADLAKILAAAGCSFPSRCAG